MKIIDMTGRNKALCHDEGIDVFMLFETELLAKHLHQMESGSNVQNYGLSFTRHKLEHDCIVTNKM